MNAESRCAQHGNEAFFVSIVGVGVRHGDEKICSQTFGMISDVICRCLYRIVIFICKM